MFIYVNNNYFIWLIVSIIYSSITIIYDYLC